MSDGSAVAPAPASHPNRQHHLIENVLPAYECSLLSGASGVGKTTILFQALDRFRQGLDVFGQPTHPCEFIYVACDISGDTIRATMERVGVDPVHIPHISLLDHRQRRAPEIDPRTKLPRPDNSIERNFAAVVAAVRQGRPNLRLIVIDAIAVLLGRANPNDYAVVSEFLTDITSVCKSERLTILGCVHPAKAKVGEEYAHMRQRIMGSGAWGAFCSTVLNLESDDPANPRNGARTLTIIPRNSPTLVQSWRFGDDGVLCAPDERMDEYVLDSWLAGQSPDTVLRSSEIQLVAAHNSISRRSFYAWLAKAPLAQVRKGYYKVNKSLVN